MRMGARLETYIVSTLRMSNERVVYDDNCDRKRIQLEGGRSRRGEGDKEGDNLAAFVVALCLFGPNTDAQARRLQVLPYGAPLSSKLSTYNPHLRLSHDQTPRPLHGFGKPYRSATDRPPCPHCARCSLPILLSINLVTRRWHLSRLTREIFLFKRLAERFALHAANCLLVFCCPTFSPLVSP